MRGALENLVAFLLSYAAQYSKFLSLALELLEIGEPMKDFLLGFVADRTGVIENQTGLLDRLNLAVAFLDESADHLFRVMDIHLTTEGFQVEGLLIFQNPRHRASISRV